MESWRRLLAPREMRIVMGLNVFATPLYLLWAWFFVEAFFGYSNLFVWLGVALGVVVEGLPFIVAGPPHLRSWRNFELSALLAFTAICFRRWGASDVRGEAPPPH